VIKVKIFLFVLFLTLAFLTSPILSSLLKPTRIIKYIDPNKLIDHSKESIENFYRYLEHEDLLNKDNDKRKKET